MLGWTPFNHNLMKKYAAVFGTLFNDLQIYRRNSAGQVVQTVDVPLAYGPRDKFIARVTSEPDINLPTAITLPRLGFQMTGFQYAPGRKLNTRGEITTIAADPLDSRTMFNPVPYDIGFDLYIMTRTLDDGHQLVEQILPFFTPEWTFSTNLVNGINSKRDIQLVLNQVSNEDMYDGNFEVRRMLTWTLSFTMKAWFLGPLRAPSLIKKTITNFNCEGLDESYERDMQVLITGGQTANGEATSNTALTVPYTDVDPNKPYDFIIEYQ